MRNLMWKAMAWREARRAEEGQTVIEYALVVAVVSIALIALMVGFGSGLVTGAAEAVAEYIPD